MSRVFFPPSFLDLTEGTRELELEVKNIRELIAELERRFPGLSARICEGEELRSGLSVAIDGNISRMGLYQKLAPSNEIHFLPMLGGG